MFIKWNYESAKQLVEETSGWKYKSENFTTVIDKVYLECPHGHICHMIFSNFQQGKRCIQCARKSRKSKFEDIKSYIESTPGYILLSTEYINAHTKLLIRCPDGHEYWGTFNNFQRGKRCNKCYRNNNIGENHKNWNSDREKIESNAKMRKLCYHLLGHTITATKNSKTTKTYKLLGYTNKDLEQRLSQDPLWEQFKLNSKAYHIDHIFPIKSFIDCGITDPSIINSLDNLQILPARENMSKNDKYDKTLFENYLSQKGILLNELKS